MRGKEIILLGKDTLSKDSNSKILGGSIRTVIFGDIIFKWIECLR